MKNIKTVLLVMGTAMVLSLTISSCKKDEPYVKPQLSFSSATGTFKESDGTVQIEVSIDKVAKEDFTIQYSFDGSVAIEKSTAASGKAYDFEDLNAGEVVMKKGEKTANIELKFYSDFYLEDDELIDLKISNISVTNVEITRNDETKLTLDQEDGLVVYLTWPAPSASGVADMDLFIRVGENITTWDGVLTGSVQESTQPGELAFIPKTIGNAAFGASYVYYDGTLDPLDFTVSFVEFSNGAFEPDDQVESFDGEYTIANLNKWTDVNSTVVVQTFTKVGDIFGEISDPIITPDSGSRMSTGAPLSVPSVLSKRGSENPLSIRAKKMLER